MELRKIMAYRSDFWINQVGLIIFQTLLSYSLWTAIFEYKGITHMGGYDINSFIQYYLTVVLVAKSMLGEDIGFLSREIYEGSLNKFIVYPISIFRFKYLTYMVHSMFHTFQIFFIFLITYLVFTPTTFTEIPWSSYFFGCIAMFLSSSLYFIMSCILESVSFWAEFIWSLMVLLRMTTNFLGGTLIPISFYPQWAQDALVYTPFPYIITFPLKVFMNQYTMEFFIQNTLIICSWSLLFFGIFLIIWNRGKYHYTGVGI